jgi:glycosyltransferase involved in cell wall biosynthesis
LLTTIAAQEEKNFEVIIVDGNSEDKTTAVARSFAKHFPLRIINAKKRGVSAQRNQGANEAKNDYLLFLDADSQIGPAFTRLNTGQIKKDAVSVIIPYLQIGKESILIQSLFLAGNFLLTPMLFVKKPFSSGGNLIIRRDLFLALHGFDETLFICEDHDLVQRAFQAKAKIGLGKNTPVTFSTRRVKKEGELRFFSKMVYSSIYQVFKSKIRTPIYAYEMGGQPYSKK